MDSALFQFLTVWLVVHAGAMLLLAIMSYVASVWALNGLAALDRWLYRIEFMHDKTASGDVSSPRRGLG